MITHLCKRLINYSQKKPHRIKRSLSLLEILIALALMGIILSMLFSMIFQAMSFNTQLDRQMSKGYLNILCQKRLEYIFSHLTGEQHPQSLFYVEQFPVNTQLYTECLFITFDNGIDPTSEFSNTVMGQIFVDSQHQLILRLWPMPNLLEGKPLIPYREEILLKNVIGVDYSFFHWFKETNEGKWVNEWKKDEAHLPHIVRLSIRQELPDLRERAFLFSFLIPQSIKQIEYD